MGQGAAVKNWRGPNERTSQGRRRLVMVAGTAAATSSLAAIGCRPATPSLPVGGFVASAMADGHRWRDGKDWASASAPAGRPRRVDVVIAGGGVAGLAAARALRMRGREDVVVLEAEDRLGGNARSTTLGAWSCPLGAHYLPVPALHDEDLLALCDELGLARHQGSRWVWNERHLCHSPQERLFFRGTWQEGLLPAQGLPAAAQDQFGRFARTVESARQLADWRIPVLNRPLAGMQLSLNAINFDDWLGQLGFDDPHLRWYLDYCCRDDYGAGTATVSALAGVAYFASRHGFAHPDTGSGSDGASGSESAGVFTWPEGNAWLVQRLARHLAPERVLASHLVTRVEVERDGVRVDAVDLRSGEPQRWLARACVLALPMHVARRVLVSPPQALLEAARDTQHSAWVLVNLHLREALADRPGAAPAWDNVVFGGRGLGYVDAAHQSLRAARGAGVITWYAALGASVQARQILQSAGWAHWYQMALDDLKAPHPELPDLVRDVSVARHGHAMAVPVPNALGTAARQALHPDTMRTMQPRSRLWFAHSDIAGYSVFEEAFALGHRAGMGIA